MGGGLLHYMLLVTLLSLLSARVVSAAPTFNTMADPGNILAVIILILAAGVTALGLLGRYARLKREWSTLPSTQA
jgi:hypothetical protein